MTSHRDRESGPTRPLPRRIDETGLHRQVRVIAGLDPALGRVVRRWGHPPLWGRRPGFATLVRIILEQQVSLASGAAMYGRLRRAIGALTPGSVLAVGERGLRKLGVTRQKSSYLIALAGRMNSGSLDLSKVSRARDDEARTMLCSVRGIGRWTADIYLLMALRRPDIWPSGDLALVTSLQHVRGWKKRPTEKAAADYAQRWSPRRSIAARILWHGYLSEKLSRR